MMMNLPLKASMLAFILSTASAHTFRQLDPKEKLKCKEVKLMNKCEHDTKRINGREGGMVVQQGDLITHRGNLTDPVTGAKVGSMHSTCLLMYGGLNVGTGVANVTLDEEVTQFMFQGLFQTAEPHGNFELGITGSTGKIKNAQGWIEMNMLEGGEGVGHPANFHICTRDSE